MPNGPEFSRHWRLKNSRYRLIGEICNGCGAKIFPPRDVCPICNTDGQSEFEFSGRGKVYSFTTVYEAPAGYKEQAPYTVALVELEEGPMITAQLTDDLDEPIKIGMPVEMVTRRLKTEGERGQLVYGYKFRPVLERAPTR
jgi:uncharacterized OB-fold protein